MANNFIDISKFPKAGDPNANFKAWVDEILPHAGNENIDPILNPQDLPDQFITMPDMWALSAVGDPRFSLGHMLSAAFKEFYPRIQLYQEIKLAGGCQVVDNYICNSDGVPIKEISTICPAGTSYDIIEPQEIIQFVQNTYNIQVEYDTNAFVTYIKQNFLDKGYDLEMLQYPNIQFILLIKVTNGTTDTKYFKYNYQQREYLETAFNTTTKDIDTSNMDAEMIRATTEDVPLYYTPNF